MCLMLLAESQQQDEEDSLAVYTWEEIEKHNNSESLWMVIHNKVYDVTKFMEEVWLYKIYCNITYTVDRPLY